MTEIEIRCAAKAEAQLGEGPVWDEARGRLWWLDIKGRRVHWLDVASGAPGSVAVALQVTSIAPRAGGPGLLAATEDGVGLLDPETGAYEKRFDPEPERPKNRANDGNVDIRGRYWFGTMDDDQPSTAGAVYSLDADWSWRRVLDGISITNTLVCDPSGEWLYVADSGAARIDAFPIDQAAGTLGAGREFALVGGDGTGPDGSAMDAEGYLWTAIWGGARLERRSPDGVVERTVALPVKNPTSCAFGGPGLNTLYVTSARQTLSAEGLARYPLSGSLLAFEPGVAGLALPPFAG
ncbi:MAG: SMP-30/gluconolactonase/LRE family protein [Proteobacteria bacterium]|nr:SMP-30/gluconolactonase/LRE family protein [Pseudomonadota bacterium]